VAGQVGRDQVGEVAHRRERSLDRFALEGQVGARLAGERLLPGRRLAIEGEDRGGIVGEAGHHSRIQPMARVLAHDARGVLLASQHLLEGGVRGNVDDPHRQRDLLPFCGADRVLPVPARHEVGEQTPHRRGKADPVGQHLPHLAHGGELRACYPRHPRQPARRLSRASERRTVRIGQRAEEPHEHLAL
jgi:hypothetical protein